MLHKSILETIGNTPMVKIEKMHTNPNIKMYAKLEGNNPSGSIKDRIAKFMIDEAEKAGHLEKDDIILEATSGNTGISLALIAKLRKYQLKVVIPEDVSSERLELLKAYGADIVLSEGSKGANGAIQLADRLAKNGQYYLPDQYSNPGNVEAHYNTTGQEILDDLPHVDFLVAGLGTGGTLMGVGKRIKERNPNVKIVAVQPYPKGGLQGLRNISDGFIPPIVDLKLIDDNYVVKDEHAFLATKRLLDEEGIFAGISSGAVVHVAADIAGRVDGGTMVIILADGGWKYLSHRIWMRTPEELSRDYSGPPW